MQPTYTVSERKAWIKQNLSVGSVIQLFGDEFDDEPWVYVVLDISTASIRAARLDRPSLSFLIIDVKEVMSDLTNPSPGSARWEIVT